MFMKPGNSIKSHDRNDRIFIIVSFLLFCACFCFLFGFLNVNLERFLNSDDSSEFMLARLLAEENRLITPNWFYSTELRVFNTQIVYAVFFKFFNNWHKIRIVSEILLSLTMIVSAYWLFSVFKLKKYAWLGLTILILPTSVHYLEIVLKGAYYYPHIVISILTVAILESLRNLNGKKFISFILLTVLCLLAFLSGLGGPRQILIIYAPLVVTAIVLLIVNCAGNYKNGEKSIGKCVSAAIKGGSAPLLGTVLTFIFGLAGYLINSTVLHLYYDYYSYTINFRSFSINRLKDVIAFYFLNFGYTEGKVFSFNLVHNIVSFVWFAVFVVSLIVGLKRKKKDLYFRFSLLTLASYLLYVLVFIFTDITFKDRHSLVLIWMTIPCIFFLFEEIRNKVNMRYIPVIIFCGLILITSACQYKTFSQRDDLSELKKITAFLTENGYKDGYATFWNGNVLTELSNGYLEVWISSDELNEGENNDRTFEWLQLKSHVYEHPEGKVFWVLSEDQRRDSRLIKNVPDRHIIYETPEEVNWDVFDNTKLVKRYYVYGFSSYDELYGLIGNITISDNYTVAPGKEYKTRNVELYPDDYYVIITGTDLDLVDAGIQYDPVVVKDFKKTTWNRPHDISSTVVSRSNEHIVLKFKLDEATKNLRITAHNNGSSYCHIESSQITKKYVYHSDFFSSQYVVRGADNKGMRELDPDGVSFGPNMTLVPGTYTMEVEGAGLTDIGFGVTYKQDGEIRTIPGKVIKHTDSIIEYEFTLDNTTDNCEFKVSNTSGKSCTLNVIRVRIKE